MAPTLNPVILGSRLAERRFAHPERTQPSQPLEGSSFIIHEFDTNPSRREIHIRDASDPSTSKHSNPPTGAIVGVIAGALVAVFCA